MSSRINKIFQNKNKKLATFITGGDPNIVICKRILKTIINNKIDIVEIGMPFSDPMADGPTIQLSSSRAIKNGIDLDKIFELSKYARKLNHDVPIILMGYYNVIFHYGLKKFVKNCKNFGIDGLIVVDLQPEEDSELISELKLKNIDLIRLISPTTNEERLKYILKNSSGFLYYVTITGVTGQHSANIDELRKSINLIKRNSSLPIMAGFGIKNAKDVEKICKIADGAVVGSSIVKLIEENINNKNKMINLIDSFTKKLKKGVEK